MQDAEAEAALDADDEKIVEIARLAEPVFGERDEIDVAVDGDGRAEPLGQQRPESDVALGKDRALPDHAGSALDDAGKADAEPGNVSHFEFRVADAAPDAVLDEIGDHRGRLPVDADRQRQRADHVGAEIGDRDRDEIGREPDADDARRVGIEPQHHPGTAARGVAQGAHLQAG